MTLLTPKLRAAIGREVCYSAPEELGRAAVRYFALAIGDDNPLYTDERYAREHGYQGVIAPPTLVCETNQYAGQRRNDDGFPGHSWDLDVPGTRLVRGGNAYVFHRPVLPSDVVTATWRIADMTERTTSHGLPMLIVTSVAEFTNQSGEPLATNTETLIYTALERR
jgi:acyl dehydratase